MIPEFLEEGFDEWTELQAQIWNVAPDPVPEGLIKRLDELGDFEEYMIDDPTNLRIFGCEDKRLWLCLQRFL